MERISSSNLGRVDTPPCFSERVWKLLKQNNLEGKTLGTENGRVRKKQKEKEIEEVRKEGPATASGRGAVRERRSG